jgi:hypothetical protein
MKQHLNIRNSIALMVLTIGLATPQARAQANASNVARISFVQGSVELMAGQGTDYQQAVMNMPVLDGSSLRTGGDGQAEVEFGDGSVARLTPNSALQFDHLGEDQVHMQQLGGLSYYEFNVGDGHPPFVVQFGNVSFQPSSSSIIRLGLDTGWEIAVISGDVQVQGDAIPGVDVAENQTMRGNADPNGAPYVVAQGINGDSWDNWNQDRDQEIAQEASQQTPVRDEAANSQSENWNDLDADGNWYPVEGQGNVWVPAGVGQGWDPYGAGYWAYYPTFGYTWVSSYPWGWLPYHCGNWNYYSFGWGWAPGGCGTVWSPVIVVRNYPPGWRMPVRPVVYAGGLRPPQGIRPLPGQRLIAVDRGPLAKGPWGFQGVNGSVPRPDHQQALNFNGRTIAPVARAHFQPQTFQAAKGTAPGSRAVLSGAPIRVGQVRPDFQNQNAGVGIAPRGVGTPGPRSNLAYPPNTVPQQPTVQGTAQRPNVGYPPPQGNNQMQNQRSVYENRPTPSVHYSPPPQQQHYSPPPMHMSAPPSHMSSPGGGAHH